MKLVLIFLLITFSLDSLAQVVDHSDEHTENHEHSKNEIGMANSLTYFVKEKVFAYGLHLHYVRNIPESKFGFGLGRQLDLKAHTDPLKNCALVYRLVLQWKATVRK